MSTKTKKNGFAWRPLALIGAVVLLAGTVTGCDMLGGGSNKADTTSNVPLVKSVMQQQGCTILVIGTEDETFKETVTVDTPTQFAANLSTDLAAANPSPMATKQIELLKKGGFVVKNVEAGRAKGHASEIWLLKDEKGQPRTTIDITLADNLGRKKQ